jgi:low affinity Fe/Cu permease
MNDWMRRIALRVSNVLGSPWSIVAALACVATLFFLISERGFSQELLWDFTSCLTVVTFLMVFILQNAQNRHERVLQVKLDELLRAVEGARTHMVNLQGTSEDDLERLEEEFEQLADQERRRATDTARGRRRNG